MTSGHSDALTVFGVNIVLMLLSAINVVRRHCLLCLGPGQGWEISPSPQHQLPHDLPQAPFQLLSHLHLLQVILKEVYFFKETVDQKD